MPEFIAPLPQRVREIPAQRVFTVTVTSGAYVMEFGFIVQIFTEGVLIVISSLSTKNIVDRIVLFPAVSKIVIFALYFQKESVLNVIFAPLDVIPEELTLAFVTSVYDDPFHFSRVKVFFAISSATLSEYV